MVGDPDIFLTVFQGYPPFSSFWTLLANFSFPWLVIDHYINMPASSPCVLHFLSLMCNYWYIEILKFPTFCDNNI